MRAPIVLMIVVLAACWDGWRLLAGRIEDAAGWVPLLALGGALLWQMTPKKILPGTGRGTSRRLVEGARGRMKRTTRTPRPAEGPLHHAATRRGPLPRSGEDLWAAHTSTPSIPPLPIAALLTLYAVTAITGPALLQIGAAVATVTLVAWHGGGRRTAVAPLVGLALLALPILPTLDFLLAWPLRRISAAITVALLRMNGMEVGLEGVALDWHGQLLLFDAPCSGIRMLWAAWVLASLIGIARRAGPVAYARLLVGATVLAVAGNALRAASLFYVENGFVPWLHGGVAHEAVGVAAFAMLAAAAVALATPRGVAR